MKISTLVGNTQRFLSRPAEVWPFSNIVWICIYLLYSRIIIKGLCSERLLWPANRWCRMLPYLSPLLSIFLSFCLSLPSAHPYVYMCGWICLSKCFTYALFVVLKAIVHTALSNDTNPTKILNVLHSYSPEQMLPRSIIVSIWHGVWFVVCFDTTRSVNSKNTDGTYYPWHKPSIPYKQESKVYFHPVYFNIDISESFEKNVVSFMSRSQKQIISKQDKFFF